MSTFYNNISISLALIMNAAHTANSNVLSYTMADSIEGRNVNDGFTVFQVDSSVVASFL